MRNLFTLTVILLIFATHLEGCKGNRKKEETKTEHVQSAFSGWELIFDGNTLEGWHITQFGTQGPVQVTDGTIVLGMGDGCTGITKEGDFPKINYEVILEAQKVSGNDFFCGMTFPVGESFCSLIIGGWGGPVVGLSSVDGNDASQNETRILKKFDHNKWYEIHLKVTEEKIEAFIDNEQIIDFTHTGRKLSIRPEIELSKPFGICSWTTTAALRNIRIKQNN